MFSSTAFNASLQPEDSKIGGSLQYRAKAGWLLEFAPTMHEINRNVLLDMSLRRYEGGKLFDDRMLRNLPGVEVAMQDVVFRDQVAELKAKPGYNDKKLKRALQRYWVGRMGDNRIRVLRTWRGAASLMGLFVIKVTLPGALNFDEPGSHEERWLDRWDTYKCKCPGGRHQDHCELSEYDSFGRRNRLGDDFDSTVSDEDYDVDGSACWLLLERHTKLSVPEVYWVLTTPKGAIWSVREYRRKRVDFAMHNHILNLLADAVRQYLAHPERRNGDLRYLEQIMVLEAQDEKETRSETGKRSRVEIADFVRCVHKNEQGLENIPVWFDWLVRGGDAALGDIDHRRGLGGESKKPGWAE